MTSEQYREDSKVSPIGRSGRNNNKPENKAANFSELSRLARESKASWAEIAPTAKSDRNFLVLIFIAIILVSGITLIVGYRAQLSNSLSSLTNELGQVKKSLFSSSNDAPPIANLNDGKQLDIAAQEFQVTVLKAEIGQLKARIAELETAAAAPAKSSASIQSGAIALIPESSSPNLSAMIPVVAESVQADTEEVSAKPDSIALDPVALDPVVSPVMVEMLEPEFVIPTQPAPEKLATELLIKETPIPPKPAPVLSTEVTETAALDLTPPQQGSWFINVGTFSNRVAAEKLLIKVQVILEAAKLQSVTVNNRSLFRIRASGYTSRAQATLLAQRLQAELGLSGTWIAKQP